MAKPSGITWKTNTTQLPNGRVRVYDLGKYNENGINKLSTFNTKNKNGRVKLVKDPSADGIVNQLYYSIDNEGFVDYYIENRNGSFKKYKNIQEIADAGIFGYNSRTTKLIKNSMQSNLQSAAGDAKIPGAANPKATADNDGNVDDGNNDNNDADKKGNDDGRIDASAPINVTILGVKNTPDGQFAYPLEIGTASSRNLDRIKFIQGRLKGREIAGTPSLGANYGRGSADFEKLGNSSVTLGIQPQISDSNSVKWNGSNLNNIQAFAATASMEIALAKDPGDAMNKLTDIGRTLYKEATAEGQNDIAKGLQTYFAAKAAGIDGGSLLSRTTGAVLNPNLELLFQGPDLRQFNYTFKMSAESEDEAKMIKNIIWWFKKGMAIRKQANGQGLFLTTPNVFRIKYLQGNSTLEHPGIGKMKDCALLNCAVNYTPEGNYSTFTDGTMTMYEMTLSFGELQPLFSEDYGSSATNSIGL